MCNTKLFQNLAKWFSHKLHSTITQEAIRNVGNKRQYTIFKRISNSRTCFVIKGDNGNEFGKVVYSDQTINIVSLSFRKLQKIHCQNIERVGGRNFNYRRFNGIRINFVELALRTTTTNIRDNLAYSRMPEFFINQGY